MRLGWVGSVKVRALSVVIEQPFDELPMTETQSKEPQAASRKTQDASRKPKDVECVFRDIMNIL